MQKDGRERGMELEMFRDGERLTESKIGKEDKTLVANLSYVFFSDKNSFKYYKFQK